MSINDWWRGDYRQRYWMEITDRDDLGSDLFAPAKNGSGRPYWGYELINYIMPGDVVVHWHKTLVGEPAIVGFSIAGGQVEDAVINWRARGTVGRSRGHLTERPAWRMTLSNYTVLKNPITIGQIRSIEGALERVIEDIRVEHRGGALYLPFIIHKSRPLRAAQSYLAKMPREFLEVLRLDLGSIGRPAVQGRKPEDQPKQSRGSGRIADSTVRGAIEWRAVDLACALYESEGYEVAYTGTVAPFDLEVIKDGNPRRVEVKGSSGWASGVELTHGEVENSRGPISADLVVVDGISWNRKADGSVVAKGGVIRRWSNWVPEDSSLKAIRFRHSLNMSEADVLESIPDA